ncbi:oxidoreductase, zinc-binding dehydrogenase family protein [Mycobacteroides abscessus subsp. abscessus]|nr:oxidoreductase, zinc-binding dehydrogenase family protein [Mycobacteroides abscessus subsp. abscessus]
MLTNGSKNMPQTVQYHRFGDPSVLEIVETASEKLGRREVAIQVHAVGLNPIDYKIFEGDPKIKMLERVHRAKHPRDWISTTKIFPRGVGRDFSGEIIAIGEDVSRFSIGDPVFGTLRSEPGLGTSKGSLSTEVTASVDEIERIPSNVDFLTAATLGVAAQTVCGAFRSLEVNATDTLVISAASGGIGSLATQLAIAKETKVIGIAGDSHQSYIRSLDAIAVSYSYGPQAIIESIQQNGASKFLDCFGGDYVDIALKAGLPPQKIGTLVPSPKALLRRVKFTGSRHGAPTDLARIAEYVANNRVDIHIDNIFPFTVQGIQEGYSVLAEGHTSGKVVIDFNVK